MKEKICPITVAQAAPAIPQSQTKIKMGSRMVLIIAPTTMQTIEYFGFPSARIKLLIPFVTMRNGIPINVMLAYCFAYGIHLSLPQMPLGAKTEKFSNQQINNSENSHQNNTISRCFGGSFRLFASKTEGNTGSTANSDQ